MLKKFYAFNAISFQYRKFALQKAKLFFFCHWNDTKFCGELFYECFGSAGSFQGIGYKTAKNSTVYKKGLYVDSWWCQQIPVTQIDRHVG